LFIKRKRLIGNDYINILWLENPYEQFKLENFVSGVNIVYIIIIPYDHNYFLIKLRTNNRSKFSGILKNYSCFKDLVVNGETLYQILIRQIISLNVSITYTIQSKAAEHINSEFNFSIANKNFQQLDFETNIIQRYKQIEKIVSKFKS